MTVKEAIQHGLKILKFSENPLLEAEILLGHVLSKERFWLHLNKDLELEQPAVQRFLDALERRADGEPVAYITGKKEFWSLPLKVTRATLIPRPETELLVETAAEIIRKEKIRFPLIADMGTGSGAIAVALATEIDDALIVAVDISFEALCVAKENARSSRVDSRILLVQADWFSAFKTCVSGTGGKKGKPATPCFDLIVSNPPYIAFREKKSLSREITEFEPPYALFSDDEGLSDIETLLSRVNAYLRPGGWFLCEIGSEQGQSVRLMAKEMKMFRHIEIRKDLSGNDRVFVCRV